MRTITILFISLNLFIQPSIAQQRSITCSSVRNADNSLSIFSESQEYGEYTIKLIFSVLTGYRTTPGVTGDIAITTIDRGKKEIMKLTQDKLAPVADFRYSYTYYPGRALRRAPDSSFVYLLPSTTGNSLRLFQVTSLAERLGKKETDDFQATGFVYKLGDTICASRAGTVYDCNDALKEGEKREEFYKSERNNIGIQHRDGSLDRYAVAGPIKLLVKPGDDVFPGQPLAIFNKESEKYYVFFSTYYLDQNRVNIKTAYGTPTPSAYVYMPTHFYVSENDKSVLLELSKQYTVQHSKNIIVAELSKREKKKLGLD